MDGWWYAPLIDSNTGKALAAMSSLKNFLEGASSVDGIKSDSMVDDGQWFSPLGQPAGTNPTRPGLYLKHGKKMIVERK